MDYNIIVEQQRTATIKMIFQNLDISSLVFKAQIRERTKAESLVADFHIDKDTSDNSITLTLSKSVTEAIPCGKYAWDLVGSYGENSRTYVKGNVEIQNSITRI